MRSWSPWLSERRSETVFRFPCGMLLQLVMRFQWDSLLCWASAVAKGSSSVLWSWFQSWSVSVSGWRSLSDWLTERGWPFGSLSDWLFWTVSWLLSAWQFEMLSRTRSGKPSPLQFGFLIPSGRLLLSRKAFHWASWAPMGRWMLLLSVSVFGSAFLLRLRSRRGYGSVSWFDSD